MADIHCAGALLYDEGGRLLLIQRGTEPEQGRWSLPGGRCLPAEPEKLACVREVAEETGLIVETVRLVGIVERPGRAAGDRYLISDFECRLLGGRLQAGDDAADARWVNAAEFAQLDLTTGLAETLRAWKALPRDAY